MNMRARNVEVPQALEELSRSLADWRRNRAPRERIPEELWARAAEVASQYGVWKTAKALRLEHNRLKAMIAAPAAGLPAATFVELFSPLPERIEECVLEVESAQGRLRVAVKSVTPLGLAAIIREFGR